MSGERLYRIVYEDADEQHLTADQVEECRVLIAGCVRRWSARRSRRFGACTLSPGQEVRPPEDTEAGF